MFGDLNIVVCFLLDDSRVSEIYMPMFRNTLSVPKHRHINFRCRGIIQKKAHNIQYTAKVWNQDFNIMHFILLFVMFVVSIMFLIISPNVISI